jgi:hypothetical protein
VSTATENGSPSRPLHVLREYAVLADGERGAVIGPRGGICWMCAPTWHSGSVFGDLIGASGLYALSPTGRFVWGGFYEAGTLIWRSHWSTEAGIVECREALAFPGDPHRAVVLRRVQPVDTAADLEILLRPAPDYGRSRMRDPRHEAGCWTAHIGDLYLRWSGAADARPTGDGQGWSGRLTVAKGGQHDLVLEISDRPLTGSPPDPDELWQRTADAWAEQIPPFDASLTPDDARHAYAVMRGLTGSHGGMTAAVTTSLPDAGRRPARLRRHARPHRIPRRYDRRGHDQPPRTRRHRPQLRLPLRLDPRPVLRRPSRRRRRRPPAAGRRRPVRHRAAARGRTGPDARLHHHRRPRTR